MYLSDIESLMYYELLSRDINITANIYCQQLRRLDCINWCYYTITSFRTLVVWQNHYSRVGLGSPSTPDLTPSEPIHQLFSFSVLYWRLIKEFPFRMEMPSEHGSTISLIPNHQRCEIEKLFQRWPTVVWYIVQENILIMINFFPYRYVVLQFMNKNAADLCTNLERKRK